MVVGEHAAIHTGCSKAADVGRVHSVVDPLRRKILARGDAGLEIDDARVRRRCPQGSERIAPHIGLVNPPRDRPMRALGKRDIVSGVADGNLVEAWIAGMRKNLIDTAAEHHVAGQH